MNGKERDERKLIRVERMRARAYRLMDRLSDLLDEDLYYGACNRKEKRMRRLLIQAHRILELRTLRFNQIRARGEWPRA